MNLFNQSLCIVSLAFLSMMSGCKQQQIQRDIQAIWDNDERSILVVESSYETSNPQAPYFNDPNSSNWQFRFYRSNPENLSERELVFEYQDEGRGAILQYNPVYWFDELGYVISFDNVGPFIIDTDSKNIKYLTLSNSVALPLLDNNELLDFLTPFDVTPSPDGSQISVLYQAAYITGENPWDPLAYNHIVALFNENGDLLDAERLTSWPLEANIPAFTITPYESENNLFGRIVWNPAGTGFYLADTREPSKRAVFCSISGGAFTSIDMTNAIPEFPIPTSSGLVSDTGVAYEVKTEGNSAILVKKSLPNWTGFTQVNLKDLNDTTW